MAMSQTQRQRPCLLKVAACAHEAQRVQRSQLCPRLLQQRLGGGPDHLRMHSAQSSRLTRSDRRGSDAPCTHCLHASLGLSGLQQPCPPKHVCIEQSPTSFRLSRE